MSNDAIEFSTRPPAFHATLIGLGVVQVFRSLLGEVQGLPDIRPFKGNSPSLCIQEGCFRMAFHLLVDAHRAIPMKKATHTTRRKTKTNLARALRSAINACGISANKLTKETGVPRPTITRFLTGADMKLSTASKLASYLGLQLKR